MRLIEDKRGERKNLGKRRALHIPKNAVVYGDL